MAEGERRGREDKLLEGEKQEEEDLLDSEEDERERGREDLRLGRPRTPEPSRMGLDYPSLLSKCSSTSVDNIPSFSTSVFIGRHVYSGAETFQAGYHCDGFDCNA